MFTLPFSYRICTRGARDTTGTPLEPLGIVTPLKIIFDLICNNTQRANEKMLK